MVIKGLTICVSNEIKFFDSYADFIGSNYDLLMDLYDGKIDEIDAGMQQ